MVRYGVVPRRRRYGSPYVNPNGPYSQGESNHGHGEWYAPTPRLLSQQSILLILAGMGLGYLITVNVGGDNSQHNNIGLDAIVKNLEQQRASAGSLPSSNDKNNMGVSSPMNTLHNSQREAAALLRGDGAGSGHAKYNHRRASSDAEAEVEDVEERGDTSVEEPAEKPAWSEDKDSAAVPPVAINKHHTFREEDGGEEDMSEAQKRFAETQKLIGSQSIPSRTQPHVLKTVSFLTTTHYPFATALHLVIVTPLTKTHISEYLHSPPFPTPSAKRF